MPPPLPPALQAPPPPTSSIPRAHYEQARRTENAPACVKALKEDLIFVRGLDELPYWGVEEAARLLNAEWSRSHEARVRSIQKCGHGSDVLPCSLVLLVWLWKISDRDAREKVLQNLEDLNGGAAFDRREVEESATDAQNGNRITEDVDDAGRVELRALSERTYIIGEEHRLERSADIAYGFRAGEGSDTVCVQKGIAVHVSANVQGDLKAKKSDRRVDNRGKYVDFHTRANDRSDWEAAKKDRSDDGRWESVDVRTVSRVDNEATAVKEDSNIKEEIRETCGIEGCACCDFRVRQRWDTHLLSSGRGPCVGCQCLFCHESAETAGWFLAAHARIHRDAQDKKQALVESVVVSPTLRGAGLGKRIMKEVDVFCMKHGVKAIALNTRDQVAFYTACGYALWPAGVPHPEKGGGKVSKLKIALGGGQGDVGKTWMQKVIA